LRLAAATGLSRRSFFASSRVSFSAVDHSASWNYEA
jgi:hypothetical protein